MSWMVGRIRSILAVWVLGRAGILLMTPPRRVRLSVQAQDIRDRTEVTAYGTAAFRGGRWL
jgi:hypothetical protein